MRISQQEQLRLDATPITQITLDIECRHSMIPIFRGLQHLYSQPQIRDQALQLISSDVLQDPDHGREGLTPWQVFVFASVRIEASLTYDYLHYLAGSDLSLRAMMQVGQWSEESFNWRHISDNLYLVRVEMIQRSTN